jgi:hypothetical protein
MTPQKLDILLQQLDRVIEELDKRGVHYWFYGEEYFEYYHTINLKRVKEHINREHNNFRNDRINIHLVMENVKGHLGEDQWDFSYSGYWSIDLSWLLNEKFQNEFEDSLGERILKGMFT